MKEGRRSFEWLMKDMKEASNEETVKRNAERLGCS